MVQVRWLESVHRHSVGAVKSVDLRSLQHSEGAIVRWLEWFPYGIMADKDVRGRAEGAVDMAPGLPGASAAQGLHVSLELGNVAGWIQVAIILGHEELSRKTKSCAIHEFGSSTSEVFLEGGPYAEQDKGRMSVQRAGCREALRADLSCRWKRSTMPFAHG